MGWQQLYSAQHAQHFTYKLLACAARCGTRCTHLSAIKCRIVSLSDYLLDCNRHRGHASWGLTLLCDITTTLLPQ
jgi:hypothetical protein